MRALGASPLAWVIAAQVLLRLVGVGWGLPGSDGWDNDGVAPRDFLAGLVATASPGQFFRYPPVHLALLALLDAPVVAAALLRAPSLAAGDVVATFIGVRTMTFFSLTARAVAVAMAAGLVWTLAQIATEMRGRRAGVFTAAMAGVCVPLVYYGQTSNLDVPYLFWGCLAVRAAVMAVARGEPRRLQASAVFAALAVGTKDQAYALFALSVPVTLGLAAWLDRASWAARTGAWSSTLRAVGTAVGILALVEGPLYNPRGFLRRARYLVGPASAPFAPYTDDIHGRLTAAADVSRHVASAYPALLVFAGLVGVGVVVRGARGRGAVAASIPLLVAASFTLAFNCVARRADARFVLPQAAMLSIYGGVGADALWALGRPVLLRWAARAVVASGLASGALAAADVEANLVLDPRYDAEAWLRVHVGAGDPVETYGLNAYLPRFPPTASVARVGPDPLEGRSPLPGVREVRAPFAQAPGRGAVYLVIAEGWAGRYLVDAPGAASGGRSLAPDAIESATDAQACAFFKGLRSDPEALGYRLVHTSRWAHPWWPALDLHASTARPVWIYEKR